MRIELKEIERIENYLLGQMTLQEKTDFETEVNGNVDLRDKIEAQQHVMDAIARMAIKQSAKQSYRTYKMKGLLTPNW